MTRTRRRTALLAAAAGGAALVLPAVPVLPTTAASTPPAASAAASLVVDESHPVPADGSFDLVGHGWGHGRGMSQHGALGAATLGRSADTITSTYYPGTAKARIADTTIRVQVSDDAVDTRVHPVTGLRVSDLATGTAATLPEGPARWRTVVVGGAMRVQGLVGGAWTDQPLAGRLTFPGPMRFDAPGTVRVDLPGGLWRDYRGTTWSHRTGTSTLQTVVHLSMEEYLLGVVPRESLASWPAAALQAQAIAARSYSVNKRDRVGGAGIADICDTTACQVFGGTRVRDAAGTVTELEPASTSAAVRATAGVIRTYQGRAIFAEFSSSNGGHSTAGDFPYLVAKPDPWDGVTGSEVHRWTAQLPVGLLERAHPQVGSLLRLRITGRDGRGEWGGRVTQVRLEGTAGSVTTTGRALYLLRTWPGVSDGLRHQWFTVLREPAAQVLGAQVVAQGPRPTVRSGGTVTTWYDLRNTGNTAWQVGGPVRSWSRTRGNPSAAPSWLHPTRPGPIARNQSQPGARSVPPGQVARFVVVLAGNGRAPGARTEGFGVVWESVWASSALVVVRYAVV